MTPRTMYYVLRDAGDFRRVETIAAEVSARAFESRAHRSTEPGKPLAELPQLVRCEPYDARLTLRVCTTRHKSAQANHKSGRKAIATIEAKLSACRSCAAGAARCGREPPKPRKAPQLKPCRDCADPIALGAHARCEPCLTLYLSREGRGLMIGKGKEPDAVAVAQRNERRMER